MNHVGHIDEPSGNGLYFKQYKCSRTSELDRKWEYLLETLYSTTTRSLGSRKRDFTYFIYVKLVLTLIIFTFDRKTVAVG